VSDTNDSRVTHDLQTQPNAYRDFDVAQILNDLGEEDTGLGFSEIIKATAPDPPFVSKLITWSDSSKTKKRAETTFNRDANGVFVQSVVKEIFNENGSSVVATINTVLNRDGNNQVISADVTVTRP